jgi:hypothetical protein
MRPIALAPALGALLLTGTAAAQVCDPVPEIPFTAFGQSEARSFEDIKGRLVLLEVFAHW